MSTYDEAVTEYNRIMEHLDTIVDELELGSESFIMEALITEEIDGGFSVDCGGIFYSLNETGEGHAALELEEFIFG